MKKTLCVVMMLVLSLFAFAGCGGSATPETVDRWEAGESQTYKISLLTAEWFAGTSVALDSSEAPTNSIYSRTAGVQVLPTAVDGEMTYTISQNGQNQWVFDITMQVEQTYTTTNFDDGWKSEIKDSAVYSENGNTVKFKSTMTSQAVFNQLNAGGKAVSSFKQVKSVVVYNNEKAAQAANDSSVKYISVSYNDFRTETAYQDNKAVTKFIDNAGTANKQSEKTVDIGDGLVFDNEAMLLAIRSIDLEALANAQQMSLDFFNGTEQDKQQIAVAYGTNLFKFNDSDENAPTYYRIAATPVGTGFAYYFYVEKQGKMRPAGSSIARDIPTYKVEQMNQGYMNFKRV